MEHWRVQSISKSMLSTSPNVMSQSLFFEKPTRVVLQKLVIEWYRSFRMGTKIWPTTFRNSFLTPFTSSMFSILKSIYGKQVNVFSTKAVTNTNHGVISTNIPFKKAVFQKSSRNLRIILIYEILKMPLGL